MKRIISFVIVLTMLILPQFSKDGGVSFKAEEAEKSILYQYHDFENKKIISSANMGGEIKLGSENGNHFMHYVTPAGTKATSYTDVAYEQVALYDECVIDAVITPIAVEGTSYIGIFDARDMDGNWRLGARAYSDGTIKMRSGELLGTWEAGVPFRYSAVYNTKEGLCDVYLNGLLVKENIKVLTIRPCVFRIDMRAQNGDGRLEFYLDNVALYSGGVLRDNIAEYADQNHGVSIMENSGGVRTVLGDAAAYTVYGDYYYFGGEKKTYSSEMVRPIIINDIPYVSECFILECAGMHVDKETIEACENAVLKNGEMYISVEELAMLSGKEYLYDKRGFFILSDNIFPYTDDENFLRMTEPIDEIYRFLQFANASGYEMLHDFKSGAMANVHPRILYTKEDIDYIIAKSANDEEMQACVERAILSADEAMNNDTRFTADCLDTEKQGQARTFQSVITELAQGYLLTGDAKYAEKAAEYMNLLSKWESLAYNTSNLTTGHWAMGMAIGYDSFYNYLNKTENGRQCLESIKEAAVRLPFYDTIRAYKARGGVRWITIRDNFSGVCGGGVMALTLALADEEDISDQIAYLLENVIKSNQIAVSLYNSNGGYYEGVSYSEYMLGNLTQGIDALITCCGSDYGLGSALGFTNAGSFFVYMQGQKNMLNFHDCSRDIIESELPFWFAYRYGKTDAAKMQMSQIKLRKNNVSVRGKLHYEYSKDIYGESDVANIPLDSYFPITESGSFRNSFSEKEPVFVGFHGGRTNMAHDMLDLGQFVFEAEGVPWAIDLGADSYSLPSYFARDGYRIYRKRPEGENCVVINPADLYEDSSQTTEYYGQALGVCSELIDFESKPRGAKVAYDLTSAYQRDVNSYKRGYLFGDERNTLTVQDEINLKESSEVYWFMHTPADIEIIDKNNAILSSGYEKLKVSVYCNADDFELLNMEAAPLPESPEVSGQNPNTGIRKLAIHTAASPENLVFSVKLSPVNPFYDNSAHTYISMDQWSIEEGEIEIKPIVADISSSETGNFKCKLGVPQGTDNVKFIIDGEERYSFIPEIFGIQEVTLPDFAIPRGGSHELFIEFWNENKKQTVVETFCSNEYIDILHADELKSYVGELIDDWNFYASGTLVSDEEFLTIKGKSSGSGIIFTTENPEKVHRGGIFETSVDIKFSNNSEGFFKFECKNENDVFFMNDIRLFQYGKILNTNRYYSKDTWYNVKLKIDTENCICSVYVDGDLIYSEYKNDAGSVKCCKIMFVASENAQMSYKNVEYKIYKNIMEKASLDINVSENSAQCLLNVTDAEYLENKNIRFFVCLYDETGLRSVKIVSSENVEGYSNEVIATLPIENIKYIKAFAIENGRMAPICSYAYKTINRN